MEHNVPSIIYAKHSMEKEKEKILEYEKLDHVVANFMNLIIQRIEKNKCMWYDNCKYIVVPIKDKYLIGNKNIKICYHIVTPNSEIIWKCDGFEEHLCLDHDIPFMKCIEEELKTNGFKLIEITYGDVHGGDFVVYSEVILDNLQ